MEFAVWPIRSNLFGKQTISSTFKARKNSQQAIKASSSFLEKLNAKYLLSVDQFWNLPLINLLGKVNQILVKCFLFHLHIFSWELPIHRVFMHPLFCHHLVIKLSQFLFSFVHNWSAVFLFQLEISFDGLVVCWFFLQGIVEFSQQLVKKHSQLLPVAFFATQFHQDFFDQFLETFFNLFHMSHWWWSEIMHLELLLETLKPA